tara:strand:- start:2251 stop:3036 length:786 start_codon:yes stop_codon:yes gene_type:complete
MVTVFQYWDSGFDGMPDFIKTIYKHNFDICEKNNVRLVLITDENITDYITPHPRFKSLAHNHKSDMTRYYVLHKYGGFWLDTDVIIIKDLNILHNSICKYEAMIEPECMWDGRIKLGCASLYIKKQSKVSKFCVDYVNNILNTYGQLGWDNIGPVTIEKLYVKHFKLIKLTSYRKIKTGCNFISWLENPGVNKENWLLECKNCAKLKAESLVDNDSCFYVVTWTIYRKNNIEDGLIKTVFDNKRSVFSYFVDNKFYAEFLK